MREITSVGVRKNKNKINPKVGQFLETSDRKQNQCIPEKQTYCH